MGCSELREHGTTGFFLRRLEVEGVAPDLAELFEIGLKPLRIDVKFYWGGGRRLRDHKCTHVE
jgi:hypothetical protein